MKKIYLVRHAQSKSNVNVEELHTISNPSIVLTDTGVEQAQETGNFLSHADFDKAVVWNSSYARTRQTANIIKDEMRKKLNIVERESIYLTERHFGLVDDVKDYRTRYADAINHYRIHTQTKTNFFARPPLGESPQDMCIRLDTFMKLYIETSPDDLHILVSHGAAIRGILMMMLGWPFEHYEDEPNPLNASARLITLDQGVWKDEGYVFQPSDKTTNPELPKA